jgi:hypothetical protein
MRAPNLRAHSHTRDELARTKVLPANLATPGEGGASVCTLAGQAVYSSSVSL